MVTNETVSKVSSPKYPTRNKKSAINQQSASVPFPAYKKKRDQPGLALGGIFYRRARNTVDIRSRGESNPAGLECKTASLPLSYYSVLIPGLYYTIKVSLKQLPPAFPLGRA
jgi:hypothetical protein